MPESLSSDELPSDELPDDELPDDELPDDELGVDVGVDVVPVEPDDDVPLDGVVVVVFDEPLVPVLPPEPDASAVPPTPATRPQVTAAAETAAAAAARRARPRRRSGVLFGGIRERCGGAAQGGVTGTSRTAQDSLGRGEGRSRTGPSTRRA